LKVDSFFNPQKTTKKKIFRLEATRAHNKPTKKLFYHLRNSSNIVSFEKLIAWDPDT
jgi:hypothetical protein